MLQTDAGSVDVLSRGWSVSIDRLVTKDTSPTLIYSTTADQTVNSMNATAFYDAMKRAGVPVELHIFERGQHGTGMGMGLKGLPELSVFPLLVENWMQMHGWMVTKAELSISWVMSITLPISSRVTTQRRMS